MGALGSSYDRSTYSLLGDAQLLSQASKQFAQVASLVAEQLNSLV